MVNRFICPECSGELYYWTEEVVEHKYKINSKTGKINKTAFEKQSYGLGNACSNEGLGCSCGWVLNTVSLHRYGDNFNRDELMYLLKINSKTE
jgi:hypothetical protein